MKNVLLKRNIFLYRVFQACCEPLFWGPIMILFLNKAVGMTLSQIFFMESVVMFFLVVLEIPTGALADLLGRKKTILIGSIFLVLDTLLFASATSSLMAWIANFVWVVGFSLISGADSSMLFDTLKALGREGEYKKIQGSAVGTRMAILAVACLGSGYLAEINLRLPAYLATTSLVVAFFASLLMVEPPVEEQRARYKISKHVNLMFSSLRKIFSTKKLLWILAFVALIGASSKVWFFNYNPYFELVNVPLYMFGIIFFALNVVASISGFLANRIHGLLKDIGVIILMIAVIGVPLVLMGVYPIALFAWLVLFQNVARGFIRPFTEHLTHDLVDSENRATIISTQSAVTGLISSIGLYVTGLYLSGHSLTSFFIILGISVIIIGLVLTNKFLKIF